MKLTIVAVAALALSTGFLANEAFGSEPDPAEPDACLVALDHADDMVDRQAMMSGAQGAFSVALRLNLPSAPQLQDKLTTAQGAYTESLSATSSAEVARAPGAGNHLDRAGRTWSAGKRSRWLPAPGARRHLTVATHPSAVCFHMWSSPSHQISSTRTSTSGRSCGR